MSENLPDLTQEQQLKLLEEWNNRPDNPPSLVELVKLAFNRDDLDGRSKEGKAVKNFLASRQIKPKKSHEYQAKGLIELSDEQKEYISNNCSTMTGVEIAKILFKNGNLTNLSQETRSVLEYMKTVPSNVKYLDANNQNASTEGGPPKRDETGLGLGRGGAGLPHGVPLVRGALLRETKKERMKGELVCQS